MSGFRRACALVAVLVSAVVAADEIALSPIARAVRATYIHGVTQELAHDLVGADGVPELVELLVDPDFPRRDNVVAFLAHLAPDEASDALLRCLETPPTHPGKIVEDRALLLVPHALGRIAKRGGPRALHALLALSAGDDVVRTRAPWAGPGMRRDLAEQALFGLALSERPEALSRLNETAGSQTSSLATAAAAARDEPRHVAQAYGLSTTESGARTPATIDPEFVGHEAGLDFANHVSLTSPMTDELLDDALAHASRLAGFEDFASDVACCATVRRSGSARTFGTAGDGRDVLNTENELRGVLLDPVARVKVVRLIQRCGGVAPNIIGCSFSPGDGMALVRVPAIDGTLWLHEYGHNAGITQHNPDSRYIMHGTIDTRSAALGFTECAALHDASDPARIDLVELGECSDTDADGQVSVSDNCPDEFNPGQSDVDGDRIGDPCDLCSDADGDGFGRPASDECVAGNVEDCNDSSAEAFPGGLERCDGLDNDCSGAVDDLICSQYEVNVDGEIDGIELTWVGRAFGECSVDPRLEWWGAADYSADGCVDGDDLVLLADAWGCRGDMPVCEDP